MREFAIWRGIGPDRFDVSIMWTLPLLKLFKQAYTIATSSGAETFTFQESEFVVSYAKYLIEYLDQMFGSKAQPK